MSGFKRMQSKVFWGQMAAKDLENIPLICKNNDNEVNLGSNRLIESSYCNFGRESDTDSESICLKSVVDNNSCFEINEKTFNVTAVKSYQINFNDDKIVEKNTTIVLHAQELSGNDVRQFSDDDGNVNGDVKYSSEDNVLDIDDKANVDFGKNITINLTGPNLCILTPQDQGHGSLDSGFSDSETSKTSIRADNTEKKRRRRRKKSKNNNFNLRIMQSGSNTTNFLWKNSGIPLNPAHTSTPKSMRELPVFQLPQRNVSSDNECGHDDKESISEASAKRNRIDDQHLPPISPVSRYELSINHEHLGDFLYTAEPPEDEIPTTSSSSATNTTRGSTPGFVDGHWYSRISNESSSSSRLSGVKNNCYVIEKSHLTILEESSQASVKIWLNDLIDDMNYECVITLQSKALPRKCQIEYHWEEAQNRDLRKLTASATAAATQLIIRAEGFSQNIREIMQKISSLETSPRSERELLRSIEEEAFSILSELGAPPPRRIHDGSLKSILSQLQSLKDVVDSTLDTRLDFYIERVVRGLEEAPKESGSAARGAIAALTALGLAGQRASNSIARCAGVRALLTFLISASRLSSELRSASLRALSSICCCPLSIHHFVMEGGPEIIIELLVSPKTPLREKVEATALVVQITAPWTEARGLRYLEPFANHLVETLTQLAESATCNQTLLLSAAALNNLADSFKCIKSMVRCESVRKLLRCIKKSSPGGNIWLMEQVALMIGKLAKYPELRHHLAQARASVALVCFSRMAPPGLEDAYQRLTTTAITALTHLCVDPEIARQVVAVGGANCLPTCGANRIQAVDPDDDSDPEHGRLGHLKYTQSLRIACKKAAARIIEAKACNNSLE